MRRHRPGQPRTRLRLSLLASAALLLLALPRGASAATPPLLWQSPVDRLSGTEAGRLDFPAGIAADPVSGHLFVADKRNARVSEFDAWGQFAKAWGWGVADGSAELQSCGPGASPPTAGCLPGSVGSGAGQLGAAGDANGGPLGGIAVDAAGDVYVADTQNFRVQKFDSDGNFILTFGDGVNQTTGGDVCPVAPGDVCGQGTQGEGDGQLVKIEANTYLAIGPTGTVFVGGPKGTIQAFEPDGTFKERIVLEDELDGRDVYSLAVDSAGDFYVVAPSPTSFTKFFLDEFDPSGVLLRTIDTEFEVEYVNFEGAINTATTTLPPSAPLALDDADNLYTIIRYNANGDHNEMVKFDPSGAPEILSSTNFPAAGEKPSIIFTGLATNAVTAAGGVDAYATLLRNSGGGEPGLGFAAAFGPPPDKWAPPVAAPEIGEQYAVTADPDAATVRATVNPRFWADTSYRVEYGTGKCSAGGCASQTAEVQLGAGVTNAFGRTPQVVLPDLEPETTYRFRFLAQSSGGGPVYGAAPEGGEASPSEGLEGAFTTPAPPPPLPAGDPCSNALFRSGPSAFLPDCRAYEMVSPVDKANGDIRHLVNGENEPIHYNRATPEGAKLTYSSFRAFGDAKSSPAVSQYIATRHAGEGWSTHGISPPRGVTYMGPGATLETQFRAFSEDLCQGWLWHDTDPPLAPEAVTGFPNLYRTDLCDSGESYEALTRSAAAGLIPKGYRIVVQGISADGGVSVFRAFGQLEVDAGPKAAPGNQVQCYQFSGGKLRLVSVLPNGVANTAACSIGAGGGVENPRRSNVDNAVSEDGSRIFWTANDNGQGPGKIYLRIDGKNPTLAVSAGGEALSGGGVEKADKSTFLAAAADGAKAIYSVGDLLQGKADLYEFDTATQTSTPIAGEVRGVMGASEDASRVYLVSREALGAGATEGEENLYLYESGAGGAFRYIGALSAVDDVPNAVFTLSPISVSPNVRSSRLTADGRIAVFASTAPLTGFDSTDAESGEADREVFRYDAEADGGAGRLDCVSCNPTGVRPAGEGFKLSASRAEESWAAAKIPGHEIATYASRVLSTDGSRLFFESFEALSQRDTNGKQDVYEWQEPGSGSCTEASPDFSPFNGGCVSLISSGLSSEDTAFVDASANGNDVFIAGASSLLPQDPGLVDIYDARANGGFPQPEQPAPCQGEACQGAAQSPADLTPGSASFVGPPDPSAKPRARCPKGKRRVRRAGKPRCVPKAAAKRKRANDNRRAGR